MQHYWHIWSDVSSVCVEIYFFTTFLCSAIDIFGPTFLPIALKSTFFHDFLWSTVDTFGQMHLRFAFKYSFHTAWTEGSSVWHFFYQCVFRFRWNLCFITTFSCNMHATFGPMCLPFALKLHFFTIFHAELMTHLDRCVFRLRWNLCRMTMWTAAAVGANIRRSNSLQCNCIVVKNISGNYTPNYYHDDYAPYNKLDTIVIQKDTSVDL